MFPAGRETATLSERQIFSTSQKVLSVLEQIRQDINLTCWQPIRRNLSGNLPQGDTASKQTTETSAEKESGKASFTNVNTEIALFFQLERPTSFLCALIFNNRGWNVGQVKMLFS